MTRIDKLLEISSSSLATSFDAAQAKAWSGNSVVHEELAGLLARKNGFVSFESALFVFPSGSVGDHVSLEQWNSSGHWRNRVEEVSGDEFFFAEDIFGNLFCIKDGSVFFFETETMHFAEYAENLEGWAAKILLNYKVDTGWPVAHQWQLSKGPLKLNERLSPIQFFVLGGGYGIENMVSVDRTELIRYRTLIHKKLKDLPDGATVKIEVNRKI